MEYRIKHHGAIVDVTEDDKIEEIENKLREATGEQIDIDDIQDLGDGPIFCYLVQDVRGLGGIIELEPLPSARERLAARADV